MLTFATQRSDSGEYVYETWRIGESFPLIEHPDDIVSIGANGDELIMIKEIFPTFPHPTTDIALYPGDFARFIYLNMKVFLRGQT